MFFFSFCNDGKEEVAKPSAFTSIVNENKEEIFIEAKDDLSSSFPHLENLNQPMEPLDDDETSISEESLFEPIVEMEPEVVPMEPATPVEEDEEDLVPFDEPSSCAPPTKESESPSTEPVVNAPVKEELQEEENIQITKDEFIAVLQRIEKENEWYEKRQAKKSASSKKKSRRNKKKSTNNNNKESRSIGTQECKRGRNTIIADASRRAVDRAPLSSRN